MDAEPVTVQLPADVYEKLQALAIEQHTDPVTLIADFVTSAAQRTREREPKAPLSTQESSPNKIALESIQHDPNAIPVWKLASQLSAQVPDQEWEKVPADLSQRFDDYQQLRDDS